MSVPERCICGAALARLVSGNYHCAACDLVVSDPEYLEGAKPLIEAAKESLRTGKPLKDVLQ